MARWQILVLIIQTLLCGKGLSLENDVADVGETTPILMLTDSPSTSNTRTTCSGDDILREAVEVLQMDAIEDMETEIGLLEHENEEKETQIQQLKSDNEEKIAKKNNEFERKIEEIKRENEENVATITKSFEIDLQIKIKEEIDLKEALSGQSTLVKYIKIVLRKSQSMMQERQDTIEMQATKINELQSNLEECQERESENLKIVFDSQETVRKQKENIGRLEHIVKLDKNLTISYENINKNDLVKNNCNLAPWIENLAKALTEQKEKINELTLIIEGNDKIEEHLSSIQTNLVKVKSNVTEAECTLSPKYQKLIVEQSESISLLRSLASHALNSSSGIRYEEDDDGTLVSASPCECIPHPPKNSSLEVSSIQYECLEDRNSTFNLKCEEGSWKSDYWPTCGEEIKDDEIDKVDKEGAWYFLNCQEVYVSYLNTTMFCGIGGMRIGKVSRKVGLGTFSQEVSIRCNECEPEMFQWSPWTSVNNRSLRWRGSKNITNTYQEEEKAGVDDPQCSESYTTLNETWRRIEYGVPHSPYYSDNNNAKTGFTPGWHRFHFPGSPYATIPTSPPLEKYRKADMQSCNSQGVNWMEGSLPVIGEPVKKASIYFSYDKNDKAASTDAKVVACQEDGQTMYLYYLNKSRCSSCAYCAL